MSILTHIPIPGLAGKVFRCPMPFGPYDPGQVVLDDMKTQHISVVVMLVSDAEALEKSGRDLRGCYANEGWQVIHLPIQDFSTPTRAFYQQAIQQALDEAKTGKNLAVHCTAGIGRSGLFLAGMVKTALGLPGEQAITYVRRYIPTAVETEAQRFFILSE